MPINAPQPVAPKATLPRRSLPWGFWVTPVLMILVLGFCLFCDLTALRSMAQNPSTDDGALAMVVIALIVVFVLAPLTFTTLVLAIIALVRCGQAPLWQRLLLLIAPLAVIIGVIVRCALIKVLTNILILP